MANRTVHVSPVLRSNMLVFQTLCKLVPSCFQVSVIHVFVFALDCTLPHSYDARLSLKIPCEHGEKRLPSSETAQKQSN